MTSGRIPTILTAGPPNFPRYLILSDGTVPLEQRRYWAGNKWTNKPGLALLYAQHRAALDDVKRIKDQRSPA